MTLDTHFETASQPESQELNDFLVTCVDICTTHVGAYDPVVVMNMSNSEQQAVIDKINPYLAFEYSLSREMNGMPLKVCGDGMMYVSDLEGAVAGVEMVSKDEVITGKLADVCLLPVPTLESLAHASDGTITVFGRVFSVMLVLTQATYSTGEMVNGEFEAVHHLDEYQVALPLTHGFSFSELRN